jgi:hypothetical protein
VMIYNQQENRTHSNESQTQTGQKREENSEVEIINVMEVYLIAWINSNE